MIDNLDDIIVFSMFGWPINATLVWSWVVMALLVGASWAATRTLKTTPRVSLFQTALEMIVVTIRTQIKEVSGDNPMKYLPIIGTFFLFIGVSNLLTVIPWFRPPTSSLSTTIKAIYELYSKGFKKICGTDTHSDTAEYFK